MFFHPWLLHMPARAPLIRSIGGHTNGQANYNTTKIMKNNKIYKLD